MDKTFGLLGLFLLVVGCQTPDQRSAAMSNECRSRGFEVGADSHRQCVKQIEETRALRNEMLDYFDRQKERAYDRAIVKAGWI